MPEAEVGGREEDDGVGDASITNGLETSLKRKLRTTIALRVARHANRDSCSIYTMKNGSE